MLVRLRSVYSLVGPGPSDFSSESGTDAALRYIWILLANDDSRVVLHDTVVCGRCAVRAGSTSFP